MARKQAPPPPPEPEKKGLVSRWDRIFLIICVLIFVYIGARQCGFSMVQKTDDYELLDHPHQ